MSKIGLAGMSASPFHKGHYNVIMTASKECDKVTIFVSLSDRKRRGELPILGSTKKLIWAQYLESAMPNNVEIVYGGSPVGNIYKVLEDANLTFSTDTFLVYSDPIDLDQNFSKSAIQKYSGGLLDKGQLKLVPISRASTENISGTTMRKFLSSNNKQSFIGNIPNEVDAEGIWNLLKRDSVKELRNP